MLQTGDKNSGWETYAYHYNGFGGCTAGWMGGGYTKICLKGLEWAIKK